jgi:hypothetical protein
VESAKAGGKAHLGYIWGSRNRKLGRGGVETDGAEVLLKLRSPGSEAVVKTRFEPMPETI